MGSRCYLHHRFAMMMMMISLHMFDIMYENIEVLVVEFVCMVLGKVDNPNGCSDFLDVVAVVVVVYERKMMMDYRL